MRLILFLADDSKYFYRNISLKIINNYLLTIFYLIKKLILIWQTPGSLIVEYFFESSSIILPNLKCPDIHVPTYKLIDIMAQFDADQYPN